jgi:hypothetical protein
MKRFTPSPIEGRGPVVIQPGPNWFLSDWGTWETEYTWAECLRFAEMVPALSKRDTRRR